MRLTTYLHSFFSGFLKLFPEGKNCDLVELFFDFISLGFPAKKIRKFFTILGEYGYITKESCERRLLHLDVVSKTSKIGNQELYNINSCLRVICASLVDL